MHLVSFPDELLAKNAKSQIAVQYTIPRTTSLATRLSLSLSLLPFPTSLLPFLLNPQLLDRPLLPLHQALTRTNIKRLSVILENLLGKEDFRNSA